MIRVYPILPVPAPRQTKRDQWQDPPRPPVARYRAFRDECRFRGVIVPADFHHALFLLPMPGSWSRKKRLELLGMPHQAKPDRDNLEKALLDSVFGEDAGVWDGRTTKLWANSGVLIVSAEPIAVTLPFPVGEFEAAATRKDAHVRGYAYARACPV